MNIAVLGSNCKFSSDLAVKLNRLKNSSLVYRYDALADFKRIFPLYKDLLSDKKSKKTNREIERVLPDELLDIPGKPNKKITPLGEYLGDVETKFIDNFEEQKEDIELLRTSFNAINTQPKNALRYIEECSYKKIKECIKNSELFPMSSLNIINVFSGILTYKQLQNHLAYTPLLVVIKIKDANSFLPCTITDEELKEMKEHHLQCILIETTSIDNLFKNNFIITTFNLNNNQTKEVIQKEKIEELETVIHEHHRGVILNMAAHDMMAA